MLLRAASLALVAVAAGCGTPGTVVPGLDIEAPTTTFVLDVPEGYRVVEASAGTAVSGADGTSTSEAFLNVLAEHVETGERVLLLYQRADLRTSPVAIFHFREGTTGAATAEPPATEGWARPRGQR